MKLLMMKTLEIKSVEYRNTISAYDGSSWAQMAKWKPLDPNSFEILVYLRIGPKGGSTSDTFLLVILSLQNYRSMTPVELKDLRRKWKYVVFDEYNWPTIWDEINRRIASCDKENWQDSLSELRKQFSWEFENYNKPSPPELH